VLNLSLLLQHSHLPSGIFENAKLREASDSKVTGQLKFTYSRRKNAV
jgi:hypothetical protein